MFLRSKNGDSVIEVKQVDMHFECEKQTIGRFHELVEKLICTIKVNDKFNYGEYDEIQGKVVFEEIINALKNESLYFDMRDIEFKEN